MRKTIPRLMYSRLGRRFYVVLRYSLKQTTDDQRVILVAHEKYDVTDDVEQALRDAGRSSRAKRAARPAEGAHE